jgi:orotate phosphoribosyltransferase
LVVLIERGSEGRVDMEREGVRLHAFMHVNELFEALKENGRISEAQYSDLVDFGKTI